MPVSTPPSSTRASWSATRSGWITRRSWPRRRNRSPRTPQPHIARLAARRLAGEPVARIVGAKEFWGLSFIVTPAVLVPRPETETVVELALALIDQRGERTRALRIADLGTGSGAILLALLSELPNAGGIGTDIDAQALAVARRNAEALGLAARATFLCG